MKAMFLAVPAIAALTVAVPVALPLAASAQQANIMDRAINKPSIEYSIYGPSQTAKVVKDGKVVGGQAYRVDVSEKGATPYAVGASAQIVKPIHKGDTIMMAVWLRAPKVAQGQTTPVPFLGVVGPAPGFAQVASGSAEVGSDWKLYNARGVAPADLAPGQATIALHLAAAKAVIDLGPVFVLDMGQRAQPAGGAPAVAPAATSTPAPH